MQDFKIEEILKQNGMKWNGDFWTIEDADLLPAIKSVISESNQFNQKKLNSVVLNHISDLLACISTLAKYPDFKEILNEVYFATQELNTALRTSDKSELIKVVNNHIEDLKKTLPITKSFPEMIDTGKEIILAISELEEAVKLENGS